MRLVLRVIHRRRGRIGGRSGRYPLRSESVTLAIRQPATVETPASAIRKRAVGVVQMLGDVGERHGQARG